MRDAALVFTFVAVLTTFGIATTSFVAVLGALGIAIGLALQGTLSNLAAGIVLVLFRLFHIGDGIETGGVAGRTCLINLFYTEIDGDDNARITTRWQAMGRDRARAEPQRYVALRSALPAAGQRRHRRGHRPSEGT